MLGEPPGLVTMPCSLKIHNKNPIGRAGRPPQAKLGGSPKQSKAQQSKAKQGKTKQSNRPGWAVPPSKAVAVAVAVAIAIAIAIAIQI